MDFIKWPRSPIFVFFVRLEIEFYSKNPKKENVLTLGVEKDPFREFWLISTFLLVFLHSVVSYVVFSVKDSGSRLILFICLDHLPTKLFKSQKNDFSKKISREFNFKFFSRLILSRISKIKKQMHSFLPELRRVVRDLVVRIYYRVLCSPLYSGI